MLASCQPTKPEPGIQGPAQPGPSIRLISHPFTPPHTHTHSLSIYRAHGGHPAQSQGLEGLLAQERVQDPWDVRSW